MNENKSDGKAKDLMGRVKEAAGNIFGDRKMKREGQKDQAEGNVQQAVGDVQETAKSAADTAKTDAETKSKDDTRHDR